jgi:hypothetical protein
MNSVRSMIYLTSAMREHQGIRLGSFWEIEPGLRQAVSANARAMNVAAQQNPTKGGPNHIRPSHPQSNLFFINLTNPFVNNRRFQSRKGIEIIQSHSVHCAKTTKPRRNPRT